MTQDLSSQYAQKTEKKKQTKKNRSDFEGHQYRMKTASQSQNMHLQWAVCNLRRDSRGAFHPFILLTYLESTKAICFWPPSSPSCFDFNSRTSDECIHFQAFPLFFKDTAGTPPIKVLLYFFFCPLHQLWPENDACPDVSFPFPSISIQMWLKHLCQIGMLFLSWHLQASFYLLLGCLVSDPGAQRQTLIHIRVIGSALIPDLPMPPCSPEHGTLGND